MVFVDTRASVAAPTRNHCCGLRICFEDCIADDDSLRRRVRRALPSAGDYVGSTSQFDERDSRVIGVGAG
jgi:hypothetical protein